MHENDCTIVVASCDKYQDAWEPFFRLFHIQWPTCPFKVFLLGETKDYIFDEIQGGETLLAGSGKTWSEMLIFALNKIKTKYILFFLEDFFLISPVREKVLFDALELMESNKRIGCISFNADIKKALGFWKFDGPYNDDYLILSKKSQYRVNAQANIWDREFLLKILRKCENPWEFEIYGTMRAKRSSRLFLCRPVDAEHVFDYHSEQGYGYGLNRGTWLPKNKELFDKYGIKVNFERLGWWNAAEHSGHPPRKKRTKRELICLLFSNPGELFTIIWTKIAQRLRIIKAYF